MIEIERLAAEAEREFDAGKTLPIEQLCQPTREQKRADLARAMGWTTELPAGFSLPVWISPEGTMKQQYPPDPYDSAEDSRALCAWMITQPSDVQVRFERILGRRLTDSPEVYPLSLWFFVQPLPVIADAAWQAVTASL